MIAMKRTCNQTIMLDLNNGEGADADADDGEGADAGLNDSC